MPMKWWGWGDPNRTVELPAAAEGLLRDAFGTSGKLTGPVDIETIELPEPRLDRKATDLFKGIVGDTHVSQGHGDRIVHAAGKGYVDLIRLRLGRVEHAPDAVVCPGSKQEIAKLLAACREQNVAVVTFGGGTSVVGGVEPLADGHRGVITLDLARLSRIVALDKRSMVATVEPGIKGPALEAALGREGLTLGHFPQSFEFASVGGWVATRSAGQASSGYGRIDDLVVGLECVCPAGDAVVKSLPASAAGPALREVFVGSEGTLGVIASADLQIKPKPVETRYEGWMFKEFGSGVDVLRTLAQAEVEPDISRLSDLAETQISMAIGGGGTKQRIGKSYIKARGYGAGCLAIFGYEGEPNGIQRKRAAASGIVRSGGGLYLGQSPGERWIEGRYEGPYLRDALLDRGLLVETLETATLWSGLDDLYAAVQQALVESLTARGTPPLVMCHISHIYPSGGSLYFTFICKRESGAEVDQWRAAKRAATDAIVANGGTISHHHATGVDHAPWIEAEVGQVGASMLRSLKDLLDPTGILNPGKLLPPNP